MSRFEIMPVGPEMAEQIAPLFERSVRAHARRLDLEVKAGFDWVEETRLRLARQSSSFLAAFDAGQPVGIIAVHFGGGKRDPLHRIRRRFVTEPSSPLNRPAYALITDVFVEAESRGLGAGRALVRSACDTLAARGIHHVQMDVLEDNEQMIGLVESFGFHTTSRRYVLDSRD